MIRGPKIPLVGPKINNEQSLRYNKKRINVFSDYTNCWLLLVILGSRRFALGCAPKYEVIKYCSVGKGTVSNG